MTEVLRELLIRFKWADHFNADTLIRLIQDHYDCSCQAKLYTYKVKEVLRVIDGDTMVVNVDLGFDITLTQKIRVKGIDSPETRTSDRQEKAQGLAAKAFAITWLQNKSLLVKTYKDDKYGRMLGDFICTETGATLSEAMIAANHATVYK
jgi:micrococcal nuclease